MSKPEFPYLNCFTIRSNVSIMKTPKINPKLVQELKVCSHWIIKHYIHKNNAKLKYSKNSSTQLILLLLLAIAKEFEPSSQGHAFVGAPNGSPPVPRNVCQNATLNLIQSYKQLIDFLS